MIQIREERDGDAGVIRELNRLAFGQDQEGRIVDALRANGAATLSLVATLSDSVVGHILFSPATINDVAGVGLGPMSVLPGHQRQGIGSALVEAGIARLNASACPFVIVVGHPQFYPRFGFKPARALGITCEWELPEDVFMVLVLAPAKMTGLSGLAQYRPEFASVA